MLTTTPVLSCNNTTWVSRTLEGNLTASGERWRNGFYVAVRNRDLIGREFFLCGPRGCRLIKAIDYSPNSTFDLAPEAFQAIVGPLSQGVGCTSIPPTP